MYTTRDYLVEVERRRDQVVQAEQDRLARLAMAGQGQTGQRYHRLLAGLGVVLESWGCYLRTRFSGTTAAAPGPC